jgi:predicted Zn-dependent protease
VRLDSVKLNEAIVHKRVDLVHSVLLHELGHLVGLDHVSDTKQLMYPEAQLTLTELGRGDIAGLGFAGQGACQPDV